MAFLSRQALIGYGAAGAIVVLDQWTKHLASLELSYRVPVELTSWFDLTLAHNTGAAFSFLAGGGRLAAMVFHGSGGGGQCGTHCLAVTTAATSSPLGCSLGVSPRWRAWQFV